MNGDSPRTKDVIREVNGQMTIEFNPRCPECGERTARIELKTSLWGTCRKCEYMLIENLLFGAN